MANTFIAKRAAAGITARQHEKMVFCEVSTYTWLGTETTGAVVSMCKVAAGNTVIGIDMIGGANTASLTLKVDDVTLGTAWIPATAATSAAKTSSIIKPVTYAAADTIKITSASATATAAAVTTVIVWMTTDAVALS